MKGKILCMIKCSGLLFLIKALRDVYGLGLKEAKDLAEKINGCEMWLDPSEVISFCNYNSRLVLADASTVCTAEERLVTLRRSMIEIIELDIRAQPLELSNEVSLIIKSRF